MKLKVSRNSRRLENFTGRQLRFVASSRTWSELPAPGSVARRHQHSSIRAECTGPRSFCSSPPAELKHWLTVFDPPHIHLAIPIIARRQPASIDAERDALTLGTTGNCPGPARPAGLKVPNPDGAILAGGSH